MSNDRNFESKLSLGLLSELRPRIFFRQNNDIISNNHDSVNNDYDLANDDYYDYFVSNDHNLANDDHYDYL